MRNGTIEVPPLLPASVMVSLRSGHTDFYLGEIGLSSCLPFNTLCENQIQDLNAHQGSSSGFICLCHSLAARLFPRPIVSCVPFPRWWTCTG